MRRASLVLGAILTSLALTPPAQAGWSAPLTIGVPAGGVETASDVAVNERGDVAVAWATRDERAQRTAVGATTVTAGGRIVIHRLWASRRSVVRDIAVGIDSRGEITAAWPSAAGIRAAHGFLTRPWTAPQAFRGAGMPRVGISPRGEVLLTWAAVHRPEVDELAYGIGYAWRQPGRRFGATRALTRPRLWLGDYTRDSLTPVFDGRGNAYISNQCDPTVRIAPRATHRFGKPVVLARGQAVGLSLSVDARGRGLVSWAAGACNSGAMEGGALGRVFVARIRDGRIDTPQGLPYTTQGGGTIAVATPNAPVGTVTWSEPSASGPQLFTMPVTLGAWPATAHPVEDASAPFSADGAGDVVLGHVLPGQQQVFAGGAVAVRPVGGGPDEPSPLGPMVSRVATAATLSGRRVAALAGLPITDPAAPALRVTVWQP